MWSGDDSKDAAKSMEDAFGNWGREIRQNNAHFPSSSFVVVHAS